MRTQIRLVALCVSSPAPPADDGMRRFSTGRAPIRRRRPGSCTCSCRTRATSSRIPNRGSALDLLDNNAPRACIIGAGRRAGDATRTPAQLDTCINEFLVDQLAPDVHCPKRACATTR